MRTGFVTALCAAAIATLAAAQQSEPVSLALLLGRAAWYVDQFNASFSNVVAEETYIQDATAFLPSFSPAIGIRGGAIPNVVVPSQLRHRALKADFLLVRIAGFSDWLPFRDVFEVDGIPVRDREERLSKLFITPKGDSFDQAERIRDEGARFNLGNMKRTINNPVLPLVIVQAAVQQRFHFVLGKPDPTVGHDAWIVEYKEQSLPTIVRGRPGFDLFAHGRLWVEAATGRVIKTEMFLEQPSLRAHVTTTFRFDDRFGIAVPAEMHEDYMLDGGGRVAADATYGRFRRFDVSVDERLKQ